MAIKFYCDRCKIEIEVGKYCSMQHYETQTVGFNSSHLEKMLCNECYDKYKKLIDVFLENKNEN